MNPRLTFLSIAACLMAGGGALAQKPPSYDVQKPPPYDSQKPPVFEQPGGKPPPDAYDEQGPFYRGPAPVQARGEDLYAIEAARNALRIRVSSNGCTKKADFRAQVTRSRPARISFVRRTPDRCRSFAMGSAWLEFSYQELGISRSDEFVVTNPLTAWTGPGN